VHLLRRIHGDWGYVAIVLNGLSGLYALAAWRWKQLRGRLVWISVIVAEAAIMAQVFMGVVLVSNGKYPDVPRFHLFYGFVAFITVGLLYSYRYVFRARSQLELFYGLGGLFLMGVGIRAVLQVV
jgi:hypothetical protein